MKKRTPLPENHSKSTLRPVPAHGPGESLLFRLFLFFLLPGWTAGWSAARGATVWETMPALLLAAAAALTGALLIRLRPGGEKPQGGLACLPLMLFVFPEARLIAAALTAGALSALPESVAPENGKRVFAAAFGGCVLSAYLGGNHFLADPVVNLVFTGMALPAVLVLFRNSIRNFRLLSGLLTVMLGGGLILILFGTATFTGNVLRGDVNSYEVTPVPDRARHYRIGSAGQTYVFPEAFYRRLPAALPAALQPNRDHLKVLFFSAVPSAIPLLLEQFPFVESVRTRFDLQLPGLWTRDGFLPLTVLPQEPAFASGRDRHDLIFIAEYPDAAPEAKSRLLRQLHADRLAPDGVLIVPADGPEPPCRYRLTLPGSGGRYLAATDTPDLLCADLAALDRRLGEWSPPEYEILPPGIFPVLYEHCLAPEPSVNPPAETFPARLRRKMAACPWQWTLLPLAVGYALLRVGCGRYRHLPGIFVLAENGMSWIWLVAGISHGLAAFRLTDGLADNVLSAVAVIALPTVFQVGKHNASPLLAAAVIPVMWGIFYLDLPGAAWVPALLLFIAARFFDGDAGSAPAGEIPREIPVLAGGIVAAVLLPVFPPAALLPAAFLIRLPRILKL